MSIFGRKHPSAAQFPTIVNEQRVVVDGGYQPSTITVASREPVRLVFHRNDNSSCSEDVVFPSQNVSAHLPRHQDVVVELPPSAPGDYEFHCGMGMLRGHLIVR